jgi:hypothetical protein
MVEHMPIENPAAGSTPGSGLPERLKRFCWKPGQTGNPQGSSARQRQRPLTNILAYILEQAAPEDLEVLKRWEKRYAKRKAKGKKPAPLPPVVKQNAEKIMEKLVELAKKGDTFAIGMCLDRIDGKLAPDTEQERLQQKPTAIIIDMPAPRNVKPILPQIEHAQPPDIPPPTNGNRK